MIFYDSGDFTVRSTHAKQVLKVLGSQKLATVMMTFLLILTFLGTLEQAEHGLYQVQKMYFESWGLVHFFDLSFMKIPLPLPGGLLCMMYLGGHPDAPVRSLITIASPVNFHKSGPFGKALGLASIPAMQIHEWFKVRLEPLDDKLFHIPAGLLTFGFKMKWIGVNQLEVLC